ncbi:MAG TPA: hypothetical protein VIB39_07730 [Candidatus Angelobacter sp.]|jgi:tetratricopeptide (TPR) repeat protein
MNKSVLAIVLAATTAAVAQTSTAPQQSAPAQQTPAQPQAGQPPAQPQSGATQGGAAPQKKEIKDPAEYNAYMGAIGQQDPAAKISGLEAFLTQYPNSVMKEDALELLMGTYQQAGNGAKMIETAQKVLQANPNNLRALALLTYTKRLGARTPQDITDAGQYGEKGLQALNAAPKPDGMSDADFQKLKTQTSVIFNGAVGMAAYQAKDQAKAQQYLRAAVDADPADVNNIYPLALSYLTAGPTEKDVDGLFFIARAANLIQDPKGKADVTKFGHSKYVKYHGSEDGWNELLAKAASTTLPESGFTITQYVPPTPAQQAADLIKTKKVEEMSFAEWELVLSEGTPEDADKVWSSLKGKPLQMVAQVITTSPTKLTLAGSQDDIDKNTADIDLTMAAALTAKLMPKEGAELQFEGTPVSYTAKPFLMTMEKGALIVKAAPATHKPPVRKKPAQ